MANKNSTGKDDDLNKALSDVIRRANDMKTRIGELLGMYEDLHRQSSRMLAEERDNIPANDTKAAAELSGFYRLVQTVRRNRDVVGSVLRGIQGLRPLSEFKFQEIPDAPRELTEKEKKAVDAKKKKKAKSAETLPMRQTSQSERIESERAESERTEGQVIETNMDSLFEDADGGANA